MDYSPDMWVLAYCIAGFFIGYVAGSTQRIIRRSVEVAE